MNTIKSSLLFLLIVMCLYSCSRKGDCPQLETQYFYTRFSVEDTSFIPYHGKDTLWFQDNNGNTMKLVCYEKYPYGAKRTCVDWGSNPDCGSIWKCQIEDQYIINFISEGDQIVLRMYVGKISDFPNFLPDYSFYYKRKEVFNMNGLNIIKEFEKDSILFNGKYIIGSLQTWDSIGLYDIDYGLLRFKDENSIVWTLTDKR